LEAVDKADRLWQRTQKNERGAKGISGEERRASGADGVGGRCSGESRQQSASNG